MLMNWVDLDTILLLLPRIQDLAELLFLFELAVVEPVMPHLVELYYQFDMSKVIVGKGFPFGFTVVPLGSVNLNPASSSSCIEREGLYV